jgi:hypothetical protein
VVTLSENLTRLDLLDFDFCDVNGIVKSLCTMLMLWSLQMASHFEFDVKEVKEFAFRSAGGMRSMKHEA